VIHLLGDLWVICGAGLTHPWDGNGYLIRGDEPALIDCGSTLGYPALKAALASAGYAPGDITRVIGTHGHWDHVSGMALLREESDARFYLHSQDVHAVELGDLKRTAAFVYEQPFPPLMVDELLRDDETLRLGHLSCRVVHTPGHTPGSVCFLFRTEDLSFLIAGDTLFGGYHPDFGSDLDVWRASLDELLELEFDAMAIGHGTPGLIFDARHKIEDARTEFGVILNPWYVLPPNPTAMSKTPVPASSQ
jgi:glyoxylase-like metal-dependent hydrolase (beta-lactamase superfamily II)